MKKFTKLFLAFVMAMGAFAVYAEAEHYVYYDGTLTNPSVWAQAEGDVNTPGFFVSTPDGHASYEPAYCKTSSSVKYGYEDGLLSSIKNIYGQPSFEYNPTTLTGDAGFVDLKSKVASSAHTFYEWTFPLSLLGISKEYIEEYGIGIMYIDVYGSSPVGGTPIEEVEAEDGPAEYFTITGVKIAEPVEGQVVIERRGSKVVKKVY